MEDEINGLYIKRSQKDYSMSFKLSVVREIEQGGIGICAAARKYGIQSETTISRWLRKYGNFDRENKIGVTMTKTPQQKIFELEQKVRLLERQNKFLEQQIVEATDKAGILDKIIEIAEEDYKIQIRKKRLPEQSEGTPKRATKR
ncbi:MAG: helix-turn-helix domain-containing protein [Tidjanibacter sp.]|nr:helix-turn-helix domain-containing protein [Tidjanibacter sp.]